jgi:hypothetical protein
LARTTPVTLDDRSAMIAKRAVWEKEPQDA